MWRWDIFCKVVDNYGDIGTCWRLARQLADEHEADVRLWVDQLQSFAQLCPAVSTNADQQHVGRIEIRRWRSDFPEVEAADVVIEAFACELPESYIAAMARQSRGSGVDQLGIPQCGSLGRGLPSAAVAADEMAAGRNTSSFPGSLREPAGCCENAICLRNRAAFDSAAEAEFWQSVGVPARSDRRTASLDVLLQERVLARLASVLGRRP